KAQDKAQEISDKISNTSHEMLEKLWRLWERTGNNNDNFGLLHVAVTAPMMIHKKENKIQINYLIDSSPHLDKVWEEFVANPRITPDNLDDLLRVSRRIKQFNNL